jgi:hypothetical protein
MTLQNDDAAIAALPTTTAPRISLAMMESKIRERHDVNAASALGLDEGPLTVLSVCFLVMDNGWTVVGKSAPASVANFNADLGKRLAYEDCIRQLWPLFGFLLRDSLARGDGVMDSPA